MKRRALLVLLICICCKPAPKPARTAAGPVVRATVVTIRTTVLPEKRTYDTSLVIFRDRVRNTGDRDAWRLYDTKAKSVTFVDDVQKTARTEPLASIVKRRQETMSGDLPAHFPRVRFTRSGEKKTIQGATAERAVIEAGAYKRELWLAEHRSIPRDLFAMMTATETPSTPLAPMTRDIDAALLATHAFPLVDHAEVEYGKTKMVIDRAVISIAQRDVPESLIVIPKDYRVVR